MQLWMSSSSSSLCQSSLENLRFVNSIHHHGRYSSEYQVLKRAKNKGYEVLGTLIRANLLTDYDRKVVVMHDVVREMALWIASDFGKKKETFVVQATVKDCGVVRRMSLMDNSIGEITYASKFTQLTTLFLQRNELKNLSSAFIQSMENLVVLDLAHNTIFIEIPEQISKLASLQYLDVSYTSISELPVGFQKLKKLTHLNLSDTKYLKSIRGISKLSSLKTLKLWSSNAHIDVESAKELQLLEQLQFLTIRISTELVFQMLSGDQRLANCIESLQILNFEQIPFDISLLVSMENLCWLYVKYCHVWDFSYLHKSTFPCFTNLYNVNISCCNSVKDLTWLLFVPNLVFLGVYEAGEVKEIINKEKAIDFTGTTPFQKLEYILLKDLPKLENIYWSPLPFPFLKFIAIDSCPQLRKLPLDATSVQRVDRFMIVMDPEEQKNELEWEDEDTKNRFLPLFKRNPLPRNWIHHF